MSKAKIKKWYRADDLFLISLEMMEICERRHGQSYILKNKAASNKLPKKERRWKSERSK